MSDNPNQSRRFVINPDNITLPGQPQQQQQQRQMLQRGSFSGALPSSTYAMSAPAAVQMPQTLPTTVAGIGAVVKSSSAAASNSCCSHLSHSSVNSVTSSSQLATERYKQQLQQCSEEAACAGGDTGKINCKLNEIFIKRLQDIDCNAEGDTDLKLATYQDWVDMLLKINEVIINNMQDLETEVAERLELVQRKVNSNCRHSQGNELAKSRQDIAMLLKLIQNGYHNDDWNMQGLQFETLTHAQILGLNECQCIEGEGGRGMQSNNDSQAAQKNKLISNMKALAFEVAEKHDEVRDLKKQILCMEDEIQKAQKKIQLKDDVIKELRSDLKNGSAKLSAGYTIMPPINLESSATARSAGTQVSEGLFSNPMLFMQDDSSQFESLSHNEQVEQQKLKMLEEELNELFEMTNDLKKQNYEYHKKRLSDIFQKSESEKIEAYRKLDFIRRQLIDLEATQMDPFSRNWNDCDSGFSSKSENDQDAKILDGVRKRLRKLNECSFELKKKVQHLEIENNELSSKLQTEKSFVQRNSETLKQVADLCCDMSGEQFSYNDIYSTTQSMQNPFCEFILRMEKQHCQREEQLCKKIDDLQETLFNNEQEISDLELRLSSTLMANNTGTAISSISTDKTTTSRQDTLQQQQQQISQQCQELQQPVDHNHQRHRNRDSNSSNNSANNKQTTANDCRFTELTIATNANTNTTTSPPTICNDNSSTPQ